MGEHRSADTETHLTEVLRDIKATGAFLSSSMRSQQHVDDDLEASREAIARARRSFTPSPAVRRTVPRTASRRSDVDGRAHYRRRVDVAVALSRLMRRRGSSRNGWPRCF